MHTVELLEEALAVAQRHGYRVRHEWLGGNGGGDCEIKGQKWLFLDLALTPAEQLDVVVDALRRAPWLKEQTLSPPLARRLGLRKSA